MVSLVCSSRGTAEACLKCEAVYQVELSPHDDSGCGLSGLLHLKAAVLVAEVLIVLRVYPIRDYHLRRFLTEGTLAPLACRQSWSSYCRTWRRFVWWSVRGNHNRRRYLYFLTSFSSLVLYGIAQGTTCCLALSTVCLSLNRLDCTYSSLRWLHQDSA